MRQGIDFTALEASVLCYFTDPNAPRKARTIIYVLESPGYLYTLQFKAPEQSYSQDLHLFEKLLHSITFEGQSNITDPFD